MIFKIDKLDDRFLQESYDRAMKELDDFYSIGWKRGRPQLVVVPNREIIDALRNSKSEDWVVGWVNGGMAFILDNEAMETSSKHKKHSPEEYYFLIKHELSHSYFKSLAKGNGGPKWFWEGVAIYTSGQLTLQKPIVKFERFLESVNSGEEGLYQEAGFAIEKLVKEYGKGKLLELIESISESPKYEDFLKNFEKIYSFVPTYDNFNSLEV